jgi:hypothetical protein
VRLAILNHPESLPARPSRRVRVSMAANAGRSFTRVADVIAETAVALEAGDEGRITFELDGIEGLLIVEASY